MVAVPLFFFAWMAILYLGAKVSGGGETFLTQCYASLLFIVPFSIALCILIVLSGWLSGWGFTLSMVLVAILLLLGLVWQSFEVETVHALSNEKAVEVVVAPIGISIFTILVLSFILAMFGL